MKYVGDTIYLELAELTDAGIKEKTILMGVNRGSKIWTSIKDPDDKRKLLIAYESMGKRYKEQVIEWLGCEPAMAMEMEQEAALPRFVHPNKDHYEYLLRYMTEAEAVRRTRALAWLDYLWHVRYSWQLEELGFENKEAFLSCALEHIMREQEDGKAQFVCKKPITSKRTLRDWMTRYKKLGAACMKSGYEGNRNASKLTDQQLKFMMTLAADPHKPPLLQVTYLYNREAAKRGWEQVTNVTVRNWLNKPELKRIWETGRHGEKYFYNKYDMTIHRERASAPDVLWIGDGTPLDLYYQRKVRKWDEKNERWIERTSYYNRLDVFLVIDAYSWKILGWALVEKENARAVVLALKMAVRSTMRLPLQFQHDGGSGIEAQQWLLDQLGIYNTKTRPYNPKAKAIEPMIGKLQSMVLRYYDNWSGMNITAKTENSRFNPDFMKSIKDEIPDYDGLVKQWQQVVDIWNNKATKHREAPLAKYKTAQSAGKEVDGLAFISLFWEKRRGTYLYTQDGITIQIDNEQHTFVVPDVDFYKKHIRDRFEVAYDRDCLDYIYLYQDGKPLLDDRGEPVMATAAELVPEALHDYETGDRIKLNELLAIKDQVKADTMEEVAALRAYAAEEDIKLGAQFVFKHELNAAETRYKRSQLDDDDDIDWGKELDKMYFDED